MAARNRPSPATLANFENAVNRPNFWSSVANSLIVVVAVTALSMVLAFLAALALAKFRFYGRAAFVVLIIGVQMVPLNALIIPLYILLSRADQVDKLTGVVVTYLTFVLPFCVWTLRGFMLGVPRELEEAAMVDGSTRFGAFVRILLPLVAPGLVATSIFAFIQVWNEFIIAYVLLQSQDNQTLTVWLASFTTLRGTEWGPLMAAASLTALPGRRVLRARPPADRVRAHRRRRARMTLDELAAACLHPGFDGLEPPDELLRWIERGLGGVVLFSANIRDAEQVTALTARLRARPAVPDRSTDEEGGDVTRLEAATGSSYPGNLALGVVDDVELTRAVAAAMGGELAAVGVNLNFAPVADVNTNPHNPVIGVRSFGADPALVGRHVAAFVEGMQGAGVAACAKHFPGHGDTSADSHLELPVARGRARARTSSRSEPRSPPESRP